MVSSTWVYLLLDVFIYRVAEIPVSRYGFMAVKNNIPQWEIEGGGGIS